MKLPSAACWRHHNSFAKIAGPGGNRRRCKNEREYADSGRLLGSLAASDRIAGNHVAELVGDDPLELVHIIGRFKQARLDIDRLPGGDEGVDFGIVQKDDVDAVVEAGRLDERQGHV